jgi:uncharacterized membrane protein YidH (DUF202 family)
MPNKAIGLALLVVGVILLILGINAADSVGSEVKEVFTGTPTDKSIWLIVGGALLGVLGLIAVTRPGGPSSLTRAP